MNHTPRILCVDTSGSDLACLLTCGSRVEELFIQPGERDHCKNIISTIHLVLESQKIGLQDIGAFGCIIGPGSFTGLRIGLMTMKTFAHMYEKPLLGISTFERMYDETHIKNATYTWPAQRNHVYVTTDPLSGPASIRFGPIAELVPRASQIYYPQGFDVTHPKSTCLPFEEICGTPLARRLDEHLQKNKLLDVKTSRPLYVQEIAAKRNI